MSVNLDPRPGDPFPVTTHLLQKITELERENAALRAMSDKADTSTRKGPTYRTLLSENAVLRSAIKRIHKELGRLVHAEDNLDDAIWGALAAAEKEQP